MFRVYNAREHPKYKNGEMTEKEVFEEFLKTFEPNDDRKDGKVSEALCGGLYLDKTFISIILCIINSHTHSTTLISQLWCRVSHI